MCCFSGPVASVADTNLFARASTGNRQFLVYQMQLQARQPTAMILPLPVPPGSAESAVRFIDLSSYRHFFTDLQRPFSGPTYPTRSGGGGAATLPRPRLAVQRVGSFEASFVPSLKDFSRLDERFRLPSGVWELLPRYHDWGFAVFKLHDLDQPTAVEPMALELPRRDPATLFFPTVHIHDGQVHARADFDHNLFFQVASEDELVVNVGNHAWRAGSSLSAAREFASALNARGILDENRPVQVARFAGPLPNHDALLLPQVEDAEIRAWRKSRGPLPAVEARRLVARLAGALASDEVTAATQASAAAAVEFLPRRRQTVIPFDGIHYLSPECGTGKSAGDERSDVYAMGALLHRLLTGEPLFGEGMAVLFGHLRQAPPRLDGPLGEVVARALEKDPAQRFQTLGELAQALAC